MQNFNSIYGNNLDPEILEILAETEPRQEENPALIGIAEKKQTQNVRAQRASVKPARPVKSEQAIQTAALDSKGRLLHVGDKVVVGNDKSVGRIIALGRHAKVALPGEGEFEFPCSVLELYGAEDADEALNSNANAEINANYQKAYQEAMLLAQPGGSRAYAESRQAQPQVPQMPQIQAPQAPVQNVRPAAGQGQYESAHTRPGKDPKFESYDLTTMLKASAQEDDEFEDVAEANQRLMSMFEGQSFNMGIKQ